MLLPATCGSPDAELVYLFGVLPYWKRAGEFDDAVRFRTAMADHSAAGLEQSIGGVAEACNCLRADDE